MNFERLKKNLCDNIFEAQIKLGYEGRPMSLNYTLNSLNHLIRTTLDQAQMKKALGDFSRYAEPELGSVEFRTIKNGFCAVIPVKGTQFVHKDYSGGEFISEFVEAIRKRSSLDEILNVFHKFSDNVSVNAIKSDEFQYLVYFTDNAPDDYRYCLTIDEEINGSCHITYHRFIKEDYDDFGF